MGLVYEASDVKKMCEDKLDVSFRATKEFNGWLKEGSKKITRVTIPMGRKEVTKGTLGSIIRQLGGQRKLFIGLMDCPNNRADVIARFQEIGELS